MWHGCELLAAQFNPLDMDLISSGCRQFCSFSFRKKKKKNMQNSYSLDDGGCSADLLLLLQRYIIIPLNEYNNID